MKKNIHSEIISECCNKEIYSISQTIGQGLYCNGCDNEIFSYMNKDYFLHKKHNMKKSNKSKVEVLKELLKTHKSGEIDSMDEFLREINSLIHDYSLKKQKPKNITKYKIKRNKDQSLKGVCYINERNPKIGSYTCTSCENCIGFDSSKGWVKCQP